MEMMLVALSLMVFLIAFKKYTCFIGTFVWYFCYVNLVILFGVAMHFQE